MEPYYLDLTHAFPQECNAPWKGCRILPDGTVSPCLHLVRRQHRLPAVCRDLERPQDAPFPADHLPPAFPRMRPLLQPELSLNEPLHPPLPKLDYHPSTPALAHPGLYRRRDSAGSRKE